LSGDVDKDHLLEHAKEAGDSYNTPPEPGKPEEPANCYYTTEIQADENKKPVENLIQSVTIKRDPDNNLNKNKKIDDVFNDEEGEDDKDAKYFACKVGGGAAFKNPDYNNMQLIPVSDKNGVNDVYDYLKQNGGLSDKGDGIQLFKVTGKVDNNLIPKHIQESRDTAPEQEKEDEPQEFYYATKVTNDNQENKDKEGANAKGVVKSVTIKRDPNNDLNKDKNVQQLFEEAAKKDKDDEQEDEKPAYYYYTKVLGDGKDVKPDELNIEQVTPDTKIEDIYNKMKVGGGVMNRPEEDDGIQIFKVTGDANNNDIVEHIKQAGDMRNNKPGKDGKLRGAPKPNVPGQEPKPIADSGEFRLYGNQIPRPEGKKGNIGKLKMPEFPKSGKPKKIPPYNPVFGKEKPEEPVLRATNFKSTSKEAPYEPEPTLDDYGTIKTGGNNVYRQAPNGDIVRPGEKKAEEPGLQRIDLGDDNLECIKVSGDQLDAFSNKDLNKKPANNIKNIFKDADEEENGVKYYYRKVLGDGKDKPDFKNLIKIEPEEFMDKIYDQVKSIGDGLTKPDEGIQLVKVLGDVNPDGVTEHMNEAKKNYEVKDDDGENQGTTVQFVTVNKPNKDGKKEPVHFIKATLGQPKKGEDPVAYYKVKGDNYPKDLLDQIEKNGKPDGKDGVNYDKVKGPELPEVQKLFADADNIPKTFYYASDVKGNGKKDNGKPYKDGKVQSVTILCDPNNKTNINSQVKDVFRKADENNKKDDEKEDEDKAAYYYTKVLGEDKLNKDIIKDPEVNEVPGETEMREIHDKVKGDNINRPEDENNGVLLIKAKGGQNINDILDKVKTSGANINRPGEVLRSTKPKGPGEKPYESKPGTKDSKPTSKYDDDNLDENGRPGLEKVDVGDDRFLCVKVTGAQLSNYAKPENTDKNKVRNVLKDADEKDNGVSYYYRKVLGDGTDNPDNVQLIKVDPEKKMEDIYNQIKVMGGDITNPDDGIQLVKVVGDVDPMEINKHMLDTKNLYENIKT